jgi:hypothetical protein
MNLPRCTPYEPSLRYPRKAIRSVHYDGSDLVIEIQGAEFVFARITFDNPIGFRVLDERDLCEFWNTYSEPNGWLYQVHEGGWLELESKRPRFNSPDIIDNVHEYFIVDYKCINVICTEPPTIIDLGQDPTPSSKRHV